MTLEVYLKGGIYSDWMLVMSGTENTTKTCTHESQFFVGIGDKFFGVRHWEGVRAP